MIWSQDQTGFASSARRVLFLLTAALLVAGCDTASVLAPTQDAPEASSGQTSSGPASPGTQLPSATPPVVTPPATPPASPFAGQRLFVEQGTNAQRTAAAWRSQRPADAALMDGIARQSQAIWLGDWNPDVRGDADEFMDAAEAAGALPVFVAYNIPLRDCGLYSAGGAGSAASYRDWIRALADGIGTRRAVVVLEPDALSNLDCMAAADRQTRIGLLRDAVQALKSKPGISVYIDAGNPWWIAVDEIAARLQQVDVARADGFALNVSNFVGSADNVAYGERISRLVGGKHFVIDTSRNGQGPKAGGEWCNPSGRGLGIPPTVRTGHGLVDALLWIKTPGESDGACNGGPNAGVWWADYALGLAQRASGATSL